MTTLIMMRRKVCLGDWADTGPVHYTQSATSLSKQTSDNNLCPTSSVFTEGGGKTCSSDQTGHVDTVSESEQPRLSWLR